MNRLIAVLLLASASSPALAQQLLHIDARAPVAAPVEGYLQTGTTRSIDGHVVAVNDRYLTRDGKPWLPVMGEYHFSRYPADEWDVELAKMKAGGVDIVSTYVFWNHHARADGSLDWSGDRDLARFVTLARKNGLLVSLRMGPWVHGEARFGGFPDAIAATMRTRQNDPAYLAAVERFWTGIAQQVRGKLWKDGGPIVMAQMDNEYVSDGPGQGAAHIAALRAMARRLGIDVPFYTVTGWGRARYPRGQILPLVGGYPDESWELVQHKLPPREVYLFRFDSRVGGGLGAPQEGIGDGPADIDLDMPHVPFMGAEFGGGVPAMYRRRPLVTPADIAAMLTVQVGSGVNLYGYYMFHGGANPDDPRGLEETTASGSANDVPRIAYDFSAPIGQYGQVTATADAIRPLHYFLRGYGDRLAPMTVRKPDILPTGADDLATLRYSVRSNGDSGFLFFDNHVRQYPMRTQAGVRFAVDLPAGRLTFPSRPIDLPADTYGVWPIGLDLDGVALRYATAQPLGRFVDADGPVHVFVAQPGVPVEIAVAGAEAPGAVTQGDLRILRDVVPGADHMIALTRPGGRPIRIVVLSAEEGKRAWVLPFAGQDRLILSAAPVFADGKDLVLRQRADTRFRIGLFPAPARLGGMTRSTGDGPFGWYETTMAVRDPGVVTLTPVRAATSAPAIRMIGPQSTPVTPAPESFGASAAWTLALPKAATATRTWLKLDYVGDIGRLFAGTRMLDDNFYDGRAWWIRTDRFAAQATTPWLLTILPWRGDSPVYLDDAVRPTIQRDDQAAVLRSATLIADYELRLTAR